MSNELQRPENERADASKQSEKSERLSKITSGLLADELEAARKSEIKGVVMEAIDLLCSYYDVECPPLNRLWIIRSLTRKQYSESDVKRLLTAMMDSTKLDERKRYKGPLKAGDFDLVDGEYGSPAYDAGMKRQMTIK